ncbi:MAG: virulence factor MviN, partial [Methyloprofundus sp.]|nr:virulence factor MviN [Methyloprofundus sp.]
MKLSIKLGILSASNILLAFGMQWYILMSIGIGEQTDALFAGLTIPQLVTTVISNSLMHVLVPLLSGETQEKSNHDTWAFLSLVAALFFSLALALYMTA